MYSLSGKNGAQPKAVNPEPKNPKSGLLLAVCDSV